MVNKDEVNEEKIDIKHDNKKKTAYFFHMTKVH